MMVHLICKCRTFAKLSLSDQNKFHMCDTCAPVLINIRRAKNVEGFLFLNLSQYASPTDTQIGYKFHTLN